MDPPVLDFAAEAEFSKYVSIKKSNTMEIFIYCSIIPAIILLQNFVHSPTAQLSCHVQNVMVITTLELEWEQNESSIKVDLWWKAGVVWFSYNVAIIIL